LVLVARPSVLVRWIFVIIFAGALGARGEDVAKLRQGGEPDGLRGIVRICARVPHKTVPTARACGAEESGREEQAMSASAGIHHVTAICRDPVNNVAFYTGNLGL
jgi:hypothetical protein